MDDLVRRALATATRDLEPSDELDRRVEAVLGAPRARPRRLMLVPATAAAVVALLVLATVVLVNDDGPDDEPVVTGPAPALTGWEQSAPAPLSARHEASVVWTGRQAIVWGGTGNPEAGDGGDLASNDGAAFDPATGRWRPIAPAPLAGRYGHHVAWTGREMLVWGGVVNPSGRRSTQDGAAYDPATDTWRPLPPSPLPPPPHSLLASSEASVWTGRELAVWGRATGRGYALDGAAYDPATDRWRPLPPLPGPLANKPMLVAVAGGVAALGRMTGPEQRFEPGSTAQMATEAPVDFFDGATQAWTTLPPARLSPLGSPTALAAGDELAVVGVAWTELAPGLRVSARYSFTERAWKGLSPIAATKSMGRLLPVWSGHRLVVIANQLDRTVRALSWDPEADAWSDLPVPPAAVDGPVLWTGSRVLAWTGSAFVLSR